MPHPLFLVVSVLHLFSTVRVVGGFFFYISLRGERDCSAERRGLLWQGAPASRARVEIDCAERPAGLFSCVFVPVRSGGMARGLRDSAGLALAVSVRTETAGGGLSSASHRLFGRRLRPKVVLGQRYAGVDVCLYIQRIVAPRGCITNGVLPCGS